MAVVEETEESAPPKKSKLPLILGIVLALAGGGGGFFAVQSGLIGGSVPSSDVEQVTKDSKEFSDIAFVELPPLVISIPSRGQSRVLRFTAQIETPSAHAEEVTAVVPRIVDVLNSYLRAVEFEDLADRAALPNLRAQMLRRIQIVTGKSRVRDLLVMEFLVN